MTPTEKLIEDLARSFSESLTLIRNSKNQLDEIKNEILPEIKRISDESQSRFEMFEEKTQSILQEMEQRAAKFDYNSKKFLETISIREKELEKKYEDSVSSLAEHEKQLDSHYKSAIDALIKHEEELDRKYESAIQILTKRIDEFNHITASRNESSDDNVQLDDNAINELKELRDKLAHNETEEKPSAPQAFSHRGEEEQIKPIDWAKEHGIKSEFVLKILRDNGVKVLTQVSKVKASEFEKIERMVVEEKRKQEARSQNFKMRYKG